MRIRVIRERRERGSGTVEIALALSVFILITAGVIDMSRAMMAYSALNHSAARAARFAAVRSSDSESPASDSDIASTAKAAAATLNSADLVVATTWSPSNAPGSSVQVSVTYNFVPVVPLIPHDLIVLRGTSRMTVSH